MTKKVPITIITGFLGSGKTTLLHNLLNNPKGKRIAVIVNEFGEAGIDGELLKSADCGCDESNMVELNNGCLCCTVQEEFLPTMQQLMEKKDEIDHIVIETSGLALPKPLVQAVNWPDLKPHVTVDSVITLVDAVGQATGEICDRESVQAQREADDSLDHETPIEELFEDQLNCADMVVITKRDLVEDDKFNEIEQVIKGRLRNPNIKVIAATNGQVETEVLLGMANSVEDDLDNRHSAHEEAHEHGHEHHHHDEDIQSVVVDVQADHTPESLEKGLQQLVKNHEIYRIKGFIYVENKPMRMVIQGVGDRFDKYFDRKWKDGEERKTQLVCIGYQLESLNLKQELDELLAGEKVG